VKRSLFLAGALIVAGALAAMADGFDSARAYPNPVRLAEGEDAVTFDQLPLGTEVRIFDDRGHLVKSESSVNGTYVWTLTDSSDHMVASGIYLYVLVNDSQKKTGKIGVIR
jgi:hypothetical protein